MESMTSQSIEEGNEDATVVDGGRGGGEGASMRVDGSIETTWKHFMMFSRTSLLMHSKRVDNEGSSSSSSSGSSSDSIPSAQDKGCLVEVVRTGFGTSSQVRRRDDDDDSHDDDSHDDDSLDDDDDDDDFVVGNDDDSDDGLCCDNVKVG